MVCGCGESDGAQLDRVAEFEFLLGPGGQHLSAFNLQPRSNPTTRDKVALVFETKTQSKTCQIESEKES